MTPFFNSINKEVEQTRTTKELFDEPIVDYTGVGSLPELQHVNESEDEEDEDEEDQQAENMYGEELGSDNDEIVASSEKIHD